MAGPNPPAVVPPVVPPVTSPFNAPVTTLAKGKRRKALMVLGLVLLLGGLAGGGAILSKSISNYEDAVKALARAPVGCTTTLVFDEPATFTVYTETKGKVGELSGDCEANGSDYSHSGDKLPKVSMTLVDSNGDEIDMPRGGTASYDVGGYVGTGVRTLKIDDAGTYRLNVESDESDFAVAIGKNPKADSDLLAAIGLGVGLGGFVIGLTCLLLGLRRRRPAAALTGFGDRTIPMPGWPPDPYFGAVTAEPPTHPGFRGEHPPVPHPIAPPGQPPIRLPERPGFAGFAPPSPESTPAPMPPPPGED